MRHKTMAADLPFDTKADAVLSAIQVVDAKLDGVNAHLATLNGSVARHEKTLNENALEHEGLRTSIGPLLVDFNDRKADAHKKKDMLWERMLWLAGMVALGYIMKQLKF